MTTTQTVMKYFWVKAILYSGESLAFGGKRDNVFGILRTSLEGLVTCEWLGPDSGFLI